MPSGGIPKFTPAQDAEIAALYAEGKSVRQIAAVYGVSYTPVVKSLKRTDTVRRSQTDYGWKPDADNKAEVLRLWNEGLSIQQISYQVHTGHETISHALREAGINPRFGGQNHRFKGDEVKVLVSEYLAGASLNELVRRHGGNTTVIRNTLKRNGVELRPQLRPQFWDSDRNAWLTDQFAAGRSIVSLAKELGCAQGTIRSRLLYMGLIGPAYNSGESHPNWKGGRVVQNGYVWVRVSPGDDLASRMTIGGGYVQEHRLVVARSLGRPLTQDETVHHIDGDTTNNAPENLQLRQGKHGKGTTAVCLDCGSHNIAHTEI